MSKEDSTKREFPLIDFKLENDWGSFYIRENEEGLITVEVYNKDGKNFVLNSLLPKDWRILSYSSLAGGISGTRVEHILKEVVINERDARDEGWQYLLSILHELGHAAIYESSESQKDLYNFGDRLAENLLIFPYDTELRRRLEECYSKKERDAWAWAIRNFKSILGILGIDQAEIFSSNKELRDYVNGFLLIYKEGGKSLINSMDKTEVWIPEEERKTLLEHISKLYTIKDSRNE